MPGSRERFPPTRHSVLTRLREGATADQAEAFRMLAVAYWQPVCSYIRLAHHRDHDDAEDLAQSFFGDAWVKAFFSSYDPARARFRTFLRVCIDRFVGRHDEAARAVKRGGQVSTVSLDRGDHPYWEPAAPTDQDTIFHQEFVRALFARAVERLRLEFEDRGKQTAFAIFDRYDLDSANDASYAELAVEFGLPTSTVTNHLHAARRRFREIVLNELRDLAASDEEFHADAAAILGVRHP